MAETFQIIPGQVKMLWVVLPAVIVMVGVALILGFSASGARGARFEVSPAGLRIRGAFYGRLIALGDLRLGSARAVDLRADSGLQPSVRTNGIGLPGYRAGWFRLRDGERALLFVTDESRVAYVPTSEGYSVLLSVADPEALISSLRRVAGGGSAQ